LDVCLVAGPPRGKTKDYTVLLDTDVAMTVEGEYLGHVKAYATDEALFKCQFSVALLKTTELGVRPRSLMAVGGAGAGHVQAACAGPESHASTADTTSTTAAGLASTAAPTPDATAVDPCTENCKLTQNRGTRHWRRPMVIRAPP